MALNKTEKVTHLAVANAAANAATNATAGLTATGLEAGWLAAAGLDGDWLAATGLAAGRLAKVGATGPTSGASGKSTEAGGATGHGVRSWAENCNAWRILGGDFCVRPFIYLDQRLFIKFLAYLPCFCINLFFSGPLIGLH